MTGYGRGEASTRDFHFTVEVQTVNRRQLDIQIALPRELGELEPGIRGAVSTAISRGRVNVAVSVDASNGSTPAARIDQKVAAAYQRDLEAMARKLKLSGEVDLPTLLALPGVVCRPEETVRPVQAAKPVSKALDEALKALLAMRGREGAHLAKDIGKRAGWIARKAARIRKLHPPVLARYRRTLSARLEEAGLPVNLDDERLMREIAYFTDRSDVSEELTRVESHLGQLGECLAQAEPVGRTLEFLVQELAREFNTLGSKANDSVIARCVVDCKSELEKIKEQVQNIE